LYLSESTRSPKKPCFSFKPQLALNKKEGNDMIRNATN
jgi:hypothetical protein